MVERTVAEMFSKLRQRNLNSFSSLHQKLWKWRTSCTKRRRMYKDQRETWRCKVVLQNTVSIGVECGRMDEGTKSFIMALKSSFFGQQPFHLHFSWWTLWNYMFNMITLLVSVRCPVAKESRNEEWLVQQQTLKISATVELYLSPGPTVTTDRVLRWLHRPELW